MKQIKKWWEFWKKEIPKQKTINELKSHDHHSETTIENHVQMNIKKTKPVEKSSFNEVKPQYTYSGSTSMNINKFTNTPPKPKLDPNTFQRANNNFRQIPQKRYVENNGKWMKIFDL